MGCLTVSGADDPNLPPLIALLGEETINGWFENEWRADGLHLRDDIAQADAPALIEQWPGGRLFTSQADLRWERRSEDGFDMAIVADAPPPGVVHDVVELDPFGEAAHLMLWGTRDENGWREGRISGVGRPYPKSWPGPNAAVRAQTYGADWPSCDPAMASMRIVTRFFGYDGAAQPAACAGSRDASEHAGKE